MTALAIACSSFSGASADPGAEGGVDGAPGSEAGAADGPVAEGSTVIDASPSGPLEIAHGLDDLEGIAVTETNVYAIEHTKGRVLTVSIDGGAIADIAPNAGSPRGLAIHGSYLYWSSYGSATLYRAPLTGGPIDRTVTAASASFVIVPTSTNLVTAALDLGGGGEIQQYDFDLKPVISFGGLANVFDVAVRGTDIYWTESANGNIGRGVVGTGNNEVIVSEESDCRAIVADAAGVYWTLGGGLVRGKLTNGAGVFTIASNEAAPHSLMTDQTALYWLTADGNLRYLPHSAPAGAQATTLASGFKTSFTELHTRALAMSSTYLFWITADGSIFRLPRK